MERELITDLELIRELAERRSEENFDFRSFVKQALNWSDKRLDALVRETFETVAAGIDCQQCGNCCRVLQAAVTEGDARRLARRLDLTAEEFEERYVAIGEFKEKTIAATPCPFLEGCRCSVYEARPHDCRDYPHLHKRGFRSRMFGVLQNASLCPIAFNVLERVKAELRFRPRRRR